MTHDKKQPRTPQELAADAIRRAAAAREKRMREAQHKKETRR